MDPAMRRRLIAVARGAEPADRVFINGRIVNVFSGEILEADIAVAGPYIAAVGPGYAGREEVDLGGRYVAPGFIDGHVHLESSLLTPAEFAHAVLPHGTTAVVTDAHEIANVCGRAGVEWLVEASALTPLSVLIMAPSCVPASALAPGGARLDAADLAPLLGHPWCLGLGEMMDVEGVLAAAPDVLAKVAAAGSRPCDGHAPGLSGYDLAGYAAAGLHSDHEAVRLDEARDRLRLGWRVMLREGTVARNLRALLPLVTPATASRCLFVTDDRHADDLLRRGHIDSMVAAALEGGLDLPTAIRLATLSPAEYLGLAERGAIAPGRYADLVVCDAEPRFRVRAVYVRGQVCATEGQMRCPVPRWPADDRLRNTVRVGPLPPDAFAVPASGNLYRVMGVVPDQVVTTTNVAPMAARNGLLVADTESDILFLAVADRHGATGQVGRGLVRGFGLREGALASSVAHDAHHIIVVGADAADMQCAVQEVVRLQGGLVVAARGHVRDALPLPIAGLMADAPFAEVAGAVTRLQAAAHRLGCRLPDPFMTVSFLALPVIPALRLTPAGLVDVTAHRIVDLAVRERITLTAVPPVV